MSRAVILIDDDEAELRANSAALEELFGDAEEVVVVPSKPFPDMREYSRLLARSDTAAFVIDQRLKTGGEVGYTGLELSEYLRGINSKLPIYILTNYPGDDDN